MSTITDLATDPAAAMDLLSGAVERGASLLASGSRAAGPATPQDDSGDLIPSADALGLAVSLDGGLTALVMLVPDLVEELTGQRDGAAIAESLAPVTDEICAALGVSALESNSIASVEDVDRHLVGAELVVASGIFAGDAVVATLAVVMGIAASPGSAPGIDGAAAGPEGSGDSTGSETVRAPAAAPNNPAPAGPGSAVPPRSATAAAATADAPPAPRIHDAALSRGLSILAEVNLEVTAELGRAALRVSELLDLQPGSIIELDREAGAPVELFVNGTLFARAEVVVIDGQYAVRICELFGGEGAR